MGEEKKTSTTFPKSASQIIWEGRRENWRQLTGKRHPNDIYQKLLEERQEKELETLFLEWAYVPDSEEKKVITEMQGAKRSAHIYNSLRKEGVIDEMLSVEKILSFADSRNIEFLDPKMKMYLRMPSNMLEEAYRTTVSDAKEIFQDTLSEVVDIAEESWRLIVDNVDLSSVKEITSIKQQPSELRSEKEIFVYLWRRQKEMLYSVDTYLQCLSYAYSRALSDDCWGIANQLKKSQEKMPSHWHKRVDAFLDSLFGTSDKANDANKRFKTQMNQKVNAMLKPWKKLLDLKIEEFVDGMRFAFGVNADSDIIETAVDFWQIYLSQKELDPVLKTGAGIDFENPFISKIFNAMHMKKELWVREEISRFISQNPEVSGKYINRLIAERRILADDLISESDPQKRAEIEEKYDDLADRHPWLFSSGGFEDMCFVGLDMGSGYRKNAKNIVRGVAEDTARKFGTPEKKKEAVLREKGLWKE